MDSASSSQDPLVLPLKAQKTTPQTPSRKLSFHHNVTLTVSLTVGSPPQNVTMVLDTGSQLSWLHCKKLPNLNSTFNPLLSSSYTPTPCTSSQCEIQTRNLTIPASCDKNKLCHVIVSYADASSAEGTLAAETFSIAGAAQPGTLFGCMDSSGCSSEPEEDWKTTGLMGMNRGSLSLVTQMKEEFLEQTKGVLTRIEDPNFVFEGAMDLCYRGPVSLAAVPAVTLVFEGAEMRVSGERVLYRVRKGSDWEQHNVPYA
ncbi:aspartic proteinase PCS1 [Cajanus cajan]|nr:aspartic proteinase PCS1 [Cajanus cajan]